MPPPPGARAVSSTERLFSRKTLLLPGHDFPVLARIEVRHLASQNARSRAQILFVDLAPMVDHERLDAGDSVFGGIGGQREAADHFIFDHVIHRAALGFGTLGLQNAEVVAVVGRRLLAFGKHGGGSIGKSLRHQVIGLAFPIESVLLARRTQDLLRVLQGTAGGAVARGILHLGFHICAAHIIAVSSLRPTRRARTSTRPTAEWNRHWPFSKMIGTGKGQSSGPTISVARSLSSSSSTSIF